MTRKLISEIKLSLRSLPGKTQSGMAQRMGISEAALSQFFSGKRPMPVERFETALDYLNIEGEKRQEFLQRYASEHLVGEPAQEVQRLLQNDVHIKARWQLALAASQGLHALSNKLGELDEHDPKERAIRDEVRRQLFGNVIEAVRDLPETDPAWLDKSFSDMNAGKGSDGLLIYLSGLLLRLGANPDAPAQSLQRLVSILHPEAIDRYFRLARELLGRM